jgi:hypothetical protein
MHVFELRVLLSPVSGPLLLLLSWAQAPAPACWRCLSPRISTTTPWTSTHSDSNNLRAARVVERHGRAARSSHSPGLPTASSPSNRMLSVHVEHGVWICVRDARSEVTPQAAECTTDGALLDVAVRFADAPALSNVHAAVLRCLGKFVT